MARGGMLLQRAASGAELTYIPVSHPSRLERHRASRLIQGSNRNRTGATPQ
jgi:hypothetical protein